MKKNKEMFKRQTYNWTELGKGTNMSIKVGVNDKGIRVVHPSCAFEIPSEYSAAGKIVEMLAAMKAPREVVESLDGAIEPGVGEVNEDVSRGAEIDLMNELSFMVNVLQHFSDEIVRTMLFSVLDLYYFLITNQTEYAEVEALKANVDAVDRNKDMQGYLDQQALLVEHFTAVREKALAPFTEVYETMMRVKDERRAEIAAIAASAEGKTGDVNESISVQDEAEDVYIEPVRAKKIKPIKLAEE